MKFLCVETQALIEVSLVPLLTRRVRLDLTLLSFLLVLGGGRLKSSDKSRLQSSKCNDDTSKDFLGPGDGS